MKKRRRAHSTYRRNQRGQFTGGYPGLVPPHANPAPAPNHLQPPVATPVHSCIAAAARDLEISTDSLKRDFLHWQHDLTDRDFEQVTSPDSHFAHTCTSLSVTETPGLTRALRRLGYEQYLAQRHPVFVYGTLRQGQGNSSLMTPAVTDTRIGTLREASIYGADAPFPYALEDDNPDTVVVGEVVDLSNDREGRLARHRLDQLEGFDSMCPSESHYERVLVTVDINGEPQTAWAYMARGFALERVATMQPIAHGDWVRARTHHR